MNVRTQVQSNRPKLKKRKTLAKKDNVASSDHVSSLTPIRTVAPTGPAVSVHSGFAEQNTRLQNAPVDGHHSAPLSPQSHAARLSQRLSRHGPSQDFSTRGPQSQTREMLTGRNVEEGESSQSAAIYVPEWVIPRRCRVHTPNWCREMMTNMLERFKNLQEDYNRLVDAHAKCSDTVQKLVTARQDLEHNARLYTDVIKRYKELKEEHDGCEQKVKALEGEKNDLAAANNDQALRIRELEVEVARKDSALVAAEKMSADGAKERQKLVDQLSQAGVEKFDSGWSKGLSEERTEEEIITALRRVENFDAYFDKKLYPMYDKLSEKEYPYVMKIANGYRHSVAGLLKVHPDPALSSGTSAPTISKALDGSSIPPSQKKT
ncbi:hypothetical protein Tco_1577302 [Tanacetum coccineum]